MTVVELQVIVAALSALLKEAAAANQPHLSAEQDERYKKLTQNDTAAVLDALANMLAQQT